MLKITEMKKLISVLIWITLTTIAIQAQDNSKNNASDFLLKRYVGVDGIGILNSIIPNRTNYELNMTAGIQSKSKKIYYTLGLNGIGRKIDTDFTLQYINLNQFRRYVRKGNSKTFQSTLGIERIIKGNNRLTFSFGAGALINYENKNFTSYDAIRSNKLIVVNEEDWEIIENPKDINADIFTLGGYFDFNAYCLLRKNIFIKPQIRLNNNFLEYSKGNPISIIETQPSDKNFQLQMDLNINFRIFVGYTF